MIRIDGTDIPKGAAGLPLAQQKARTPEEAARQFEEVLIKQMLHTMTRELFNNSLAGDDGPQWMGAYSDMQGDVLTSNLAKQLADSGKLGISEMLIKQWRRQDAEKSENAAPGGVKPMTENTHE